MFVPGLSRSTLASLLAACWIATGCASHDDEPEHGSSNVVVCFGEELPDGSVHPSDIAHDGDSDSPFQNSPAGPINHESIDPKAPHEVPTLSTTTPTPNTTPPRVDLSGWNIVTGKARVFELGWKTSTGKTSAGKMPRNKDFEIDLLLLRDGVPHPGARISLTGWMPDHGHGMVREPIVTETDQGHYRVEGMLLHMRGRWDLTFEILSGDHRDTVLQIVEL